jgi:DNA end-binding protein Ku
MPHAIWSGPISFGLVNIPVTLHPATRSRTVSFHMLHADDGVPVKYVKTCPADNKALESEDIVRGYEFEKGRYVVMDEKDFEAAAAMVGKGHSIEIMNFVDIDEVDPIYFQKSYMLAPVASSVKAYRLLLEAMKKQNKAALARFVLRDKEHLSLLWIRDDVFVLETLFFHDEILGRAELPEHEEAVDITAEEMELAEGLVAQMTATLEMGRHEDRYRGKLLEIIDKKIEGEEITVPEIEPLAPVVDIMGALKESIARQEGEGGSGSEQVS